MTSNGALQVAKRIFGAAKAGHTGSLDPLATGVLPLCFGEATKFSQFLLEANKRYLATIKLGIVTATGDAEGDVLSTAEVPELKDSELEALLEEFRGEISQVPSMYSALKVNGQPLYKLARQGIEIERKSRDVMIYNLEVVSRQRDEITLDISCSKGTYVRSLAEDIGKAIGCGAHVIELRRLESGPFKIEKTCSLEQLEELRETGGNDALDAELLPASASVEGWPSVELSEVTASYLRQGQPVQISNAPTTGWVRIFSEPEDSDGDSEADKLTETFIGVGEVLEDGRIAPRRLVVVY
jgi:tRNA pseudouridine55 synthase